MFKPLKVIFLLDGTGVYLDNDNPIHLDSLLCYCNNPYSKTREIARWDVPEWLSIPCKVSSIRGYRIWHCSALMPVDAKGENIEYIRKKFRRECVEISNGNPTLTNGKYREYNIPMTLLLCNAMVAYCFGERKKIRKQLRRNIKNLGKKRNIGKGEVIDIIVEESEEDFSFVKNGKAMRFLPSENASRESRVFPPYWNAMETINVCEIGDEYLL